MINKHPSSIRITNQQGLTILEILVALTISVFLIAGILNIYLGTNRTYRLSEAQSRVQENGRYTLGEMAREIRQVGSMPCSGPVNNLLDEAGTGYSADLFDLSSVILGWDNASGPNNGSMVGYQADTDVILIKHAATPTGATANGNTPANANTINLTEKSGIKKDTIVIVGDSDGCDMFQNRNNDAATSLSRGNTGEPGNKNPGAFDFSKSYQDDMEIFFLRSALYYIGTGASGQHALRRIRFDEGNNHLEDELVEGVYDMQILYGVDTNGDRQLDSYVTAANVNDWERVVAVKISLLMGSVTNNVVEESMSLPYTCWRMPVCKSGTFNALDDPDPDRRLYRVFNTTISLRNRLP